MRTTITFDDDVAAALDELRRTEGIGVSEAVNRLVRGALASPRARVRYEHRSFDMGMLVDVTNVGEVLDLLDER